MKKLISLILAVVMGLALCACTNSEPSKKDTASTKPIKFTIEMTDGTQMKGELYPEIAPITVENFVKLCEEDFYAGTIFHRVIPGFMIQGGGFDESLTEKPTDSIKGEFSANGVENSLKHIRGVISMARTTLPNSASSQFFIMHASNTSLDGNYAAFGKITDGLDVVDKIATTPTEYQNAMFQDIPVEPQVIKTIRIEK